MSHGNGHSIDPAVAALAPIIGQAQVVGTTIMVVVKCPCGAHPLTLISQFVGQQWQSLPAACILCRTPYVINHVATDPSGRTVHIAEGAKPPSLSE